MTDDFREPVLNDEWKQHLARWIATVSREPESASAPPTPGHDSDSLLTVAATVDNRESPDG